MTEINKLYRKCVVEGCDYKNYSHGYCATHWGRLKKYGSLERPILKCSHNGCNRKSSKTGFCTRHNTHIDTFGYTKNIKTYRDYGTGSINQDGYIMLVKDGKPKAEHIRIAEKALGKFLPKGAQIHHVDCNKSNNDPTNLVICPDTAYHALIERRGKAFAATGHADWIRCIYCKQYDDPKKIKIPHSKKNKSILKETQAYHIKCEQIRNEFYRNKKQIKSK